MITAKELLRELEFEIRDNPDNEDVISEGLRMILEKLREFENNSDKNKRKKTR